MKQSWWKIVLGCLVAASLSVAAWGATTTAPLGALNYVEGNASIGEQHLSPSSVGSTDLETGQTLTTQNGRAEILLTPGVFLRLDHHSAVEMISPALTDTELRVQQGRASVEVTEIYRENDIRIAEDGATARLMKTGLYDFDAQHDQIRVFDGQAVVQDGDQQIKLKGGHELNLNGSAPLKARKFNKQNAEDDFYRWSSLRSKYLAEANVDAARIYMYNGWVGPGWYWDPWFSAYTFIPAGGPFFSPFGWGFYSPFWFYGAPIAYGYPYYYRHFDPHYGWNRPIAPRPNYGEGFHGGWGRPAMGSLRASGGDHWGGGGFHFGGRGR